MHITCKWKQRTLATALVATTLMLAIYGCQQAQTSTAQQPTDPVARGKYLVTIMGCNDCHTPMKLTDHGLEPDMARMLSGHPENVEMPPAPQLPEGPWVWMGAGTLTAFAGPWGVSYAANLTPDQNTGLGIWTEDMFVNALRQGKHMGTSREIQPPMPWLWYRHCTDEDLKSIFAYLRTIPAVSNHVPAYQPPPDADAS